LETAGFNETEKRRHEVQISHCTVTTFVYEAWEQFGKVLWSSFTFNLKDLELPAVQKDGRRYIWIPEFTGGKSASVMPINMADGAFARHEMSMRRTPKPPHSPSPRKGADRYVYKDKTNFFILHAGLLDTTKPDQFISLLEQYRFEYCFPVS
jgi:hypothetical protein